MKLLAGVLGVLLLAGCALAPQKLQVQPSLSFESLNGVKIPIELRVVDNRANGKVLGYRNAKKEGPIEFASPLIQAVGESVQKAMLEQGVPMEAGPEPLTELTIKIDKLNYSSPNKNWVSRIEMRGEIQLIAKRSGSSFKKRFSSNRGQDVVTAPNAQYNQKYMNGLLSELLNIAMNDPEVVNFLK